jgi:ABC-type uncharacterized transport system substrate-binding protein
MRVAVIVATSETSADAAKAATVTIPIVFSSAIDPVSRGLVASLNRPGGNLTGITRLNTELESKRLELLHEVVPNATFFGLLVNPTSSVAEPIINQVQIAARSLGLGIQVVRASSDREIEVAFATVAELRADALLIASNTFLNGRSEKLAALAARHAIPAISQMREFAVGGGLMSYGSSLADAYRLIGLYVGRVLNGEKPSELPVQQVTKVEMLINLQCAKKLGLTFPLALLGRADEVIE